jgi:hypothetical protein
MVLAILIDICLNLNKNSLPKEYARSMHRMIIMYPFFLLMIVHAAFHQNECHDGLSNTGQHLFQSQQEQFAEIIRTQHASYDVSSLLADNSACSISPE